MCSGLDITDAKAIEIEKLSAAGPSPVSRVSDFASVYWGAAAQSSPPAGLLRAERTKGRITAERFETASLAAVALATQAGGKQRSGYSAPIALSSVAVNWGPPPSPGGSGRAVYERQAFPLLGFP
jgi:hypothetical protein